MKPRELLTSIDEEINMHFKREEKVDAGHLVASYDLDEKRAPIVKDYVDNVLTLYSKTVGRMKNNTREVGEGIGCLGLIITPTIGTAVGTIIGYLADGTNGAEQGAITGAALGGAIEMMFRPATTILAFRYVHSEIKECEEPRALYRKKALSKLEEL